MSGRAPGSAAFAGRGSASHARDNAAAAVTPPLAPLAPLRTETTPVGPPVVRSVVRLLKVREVAAALRVSTATVYALCERGELAHVRVSNAVRVSAAELQEYLARGVRR